jgi:CDP-glucose 4,6-dehydratase
MNVEFWRGKKVFLTGHTGFKGSWACLLLSALGARVRGYALQPPTKPSLFELAHAEDTLESVIGDIRDREKIARELIAFDPDIVLHFAAQSVVLTSYEDPIETFASNVVGTASVLNAVRDLKKRVAVVNVTTDKVYENRGWVWGYRENDRLGGRDPYSSSKACAEMVAHSFRDSFFAKDEHKDRVGLANARAGNVIGGGDWTPRQLIPESIAALSRGQPVVLRHPDATRPWQHVLDCLSGYLTLASALYGNPKRFSEDWNFGPSDDDMQPVAHIVEKLAKHWNVVPAWRKDPQSHAHEERELRLNSQKAARELSWIPKLDLNESIAWTAEWYQRFGAGAAARALCEDQVRRYIAAWA